MVEKNRPCPALTDTQRLDAIFNYGLCIMGHHELIGGVWVDSWACAYDVDKQVMGTSIREAIDLAVEDINQRMH